MTRTLTRLGFFPIRKIRTSFGQNGNFARRLYAGEYVESPPLVDLSCKLLSNVKWRGFAHLDCIYVEGEKKFYLTEVNPRLPGFSYYPSQAGYDMAYYYYADLVGLQYTHPCSYPKSIYFETFRYPGDISDGIYNIIKGNLAVGPFLRSYLRLFSPGIQKVVGPIKLDDPTVATWILARSFNLFLKKACRLLLKSITRHCR